MNVVFSGRFVLTLTTGFRSLKSIPTSKDTSNGTEISWALFLGAGQTKNTMMPIRASTKECFFAATGLGAPHVGQCIAFGLTIAVHSRHGFKAI
jgi:hypothetical protein